MLLRNIPYTLRTANCLSMMYISSNLASRSAKQQCGKSMKQMYRNDLSLVPLATCSFYNKTNKTLLFHYEIESIKSFFFCSCYCFV